MATPSESVRASLLRRLRAHARSRWPALTGISIRHQAMYVYVDGVLRDDGGGESSLPLFRLRYRGPENVWTFAAWSATARSYDEWALPDGRSVVSAEEALDCVCQLYFTDPSAWRLPPVPGRTPGSRPLR